MSEKSSIFRKFTDWQNWILTKINENFLIDIKLLCFFKEKINESNVFIVTNDEKVFSSGFNEFGVLDYEHQ
jgi:hypothetical protein